MDSVGGKSGGGGERERKIEKEKEGVGWKGQVHRGNYSHLLVIY